MRSVRISAIVTILFAAATFAYGQDDATKQQVPGISAPPPSQQTIAKPHSAPKPEATVAPAPKPAPTPIAPPPAPKPTPVAHSAPPPAPKPAPVVHAARKPAPKPEPVVHTAPPPAKKPEPVAHAAPPPAPKPPPVAHAAPPPAPKPEPVVHTAPPPAPAPKPEPVAHIVTPPAPKPTPVVPPAPKPAVNAAPPSAPASGPDKLESMTRDGSVATPAAEPATLNPLAQIARMVGALLIVLLLVYIAVLMLKKYRGAALAAQGEPSAGPPPGRPQAARSIADLLAAPSVSPSPQRTTQSTLAGLDVVSMKELPGSGAMVYLIKAANRLILVGATTHGGVRTLSEWDIEETRTVEEQNASFDAYLRAQGVLPETPPEMSDIAAVRSRLHEAAARLSRKIETGIESDSETIAR